MRVLCHAQHFKGIGHFIRMHAIARGMSEAHDVYLVDGGRPVPRRAASALHIVEVPRLVRRLTTDQTPRARRFAKRGLASVIEAADPPVDALVVAIEEAMARPPAAHDLDLDGIAATERILEAMVAGAAR